MKTLEERVERCVNDFSRKISKTLIRKKDVGNNYSIFYLVRRQWDAQMKENSIKASELTPLYANAVATIREKAVELAPEFLESYSHHLEHPEGIKRFLRQFLPSRKGIAVVVFTGCALTYAAQVLFVRYRTPYTDIATLAGLVGTLVLARLSLAYAHMPNSRARQEKRSFEEAVKAEFYRVARST